MSSYFSTLSGALQEILSEILDIADQLHTASIEYTVLREKGFQIGYEINIRCLLTEQKPPTAKEELDRIVKIVDKNLKKDK
ncbi:unnamed protein product [marine sediment metagenome]|uniref:Uncharacterized protein n=1 Tax=marine sediment metagenome TaxID=412755 RepID=X1MGD1_9ZZZZ